MKKLIIHINPKCKFTQQEQIIKVAMLIPDYIEAHGDRDIRLTAYWERQSDELGDHVIICHDKKDAGIWGWQN